MANRTIALCAVVALTVLGCGGEKSQSGAVQKIGVASCDEYVTKMEACLAKTTGEKKDALSSGFKETRAAWADRAAKGGPEKDQLDQVCKAALATIAPECK